ncbi:MAG: amino acid permease [Gammaproteobacteria bacterium]|nr:amino acid permease [Gammaproteobacteria bacterium]
MFIRKTVEQMHAEHAKGELKRTLGALNLVLLGIGCIIGTGIFVLTGRAAANFAGPGIMISFIITGLLCTFVALCYAELASAVPVSGSAYSYSYAAMGEMAAWIMGLLLVLEYGLAAATVAVGWSGYLVSLLKDIGIHLAPALTAAPGVEVKEAGVVVATGVVNLPAMLAILAVTGLLVVGISESTTVNNIVVAIKLSVVIAFIGIGIFFVNTDLWSPLVPAEIPAPPPGTARGFWPDIWRALVDVVSGQNTSRYGIGGLITGAATIFFAYIGFEAVSTAGAESRNPARDMPIGILGSLLICTVLYILTAAVLVGIVPYTELDDPAPIAKAVNLIGLPWFAVLVKIGAIAGLSSVMLVLLYGQTRIFYTMARDGLLPQPLAAVHPKFRTPWINTLIVGVLAAASAGLMSLGKLADLTNVGSLAAFAIVCLTVLYLRYAAPGLARPFRTPLFPLVPILGALMCLFLLMSLMASEHTRTFFIWYVVIGILVYFLYGYRHSKLAKGEIVLGAEPDPDLPRKLDTRG